MLGRTSVRILRSTPQHICLPCLRCKLLQPGPARPSTLTALHQVLLHTTVAVQDQVEAESSNPIAYGSSPPLPKPNDSEPFVDASGEAKKSKTREAAKRRAAPKKMKEKKRKRNRSKASAKGKEKKSTTEQVSQDPQQEKDQTQEKVEESLSENLDPNEGHNSEDKTFAAGQLENHNTLSEALGRQMKKVSLVRRIPHGKTAAKTQLKRHYAKNKRAARREVRLKRSSRRREMGMEEANQESMAKQKGTVSTEEEESHKTVKEAKQKSTAKRKKGAVSTKEKDSHKTVKEAKQKKSTAKRKKGTVSTKEEESHNTDLVNGNEFQSISAQELHLIPLDVEQPTVPTLAYGLDRVLFNPGVYHLQDPRTQVFNFDPYLSNIMPVAEFNFSSLGEYITSSRDTALSDLARKHQKTFVGSTSSMTSSLAHFHYLLSSWRPVNTSMLSKKFPETLSTFTRLNRLPASVFLRYKNGVYSIDADKEFDSSNILAMLGKSLEKLLTLPTEQYERYRVSNPNQISKEERQQSESYHYTSMGDILMRSQLDAHDSRLPGTGMYDLKTRAVVSIRMDVQSWDQYTGYQIKADLGQFESYEREYYDMMRSVLLKYSLQARMGRMDGIFVAYHNIERIFGFQYMSLEEMDRALHGENNSRCLGDQEFRLSIGLLNKVLRHAIEKFPGTSLRIQFETRPSQASPWMYIFAEPMTEDEIQDIQDTNKSEIQAFERRVLGLESDESTGVKGTESDMSEEAVAQDVAASDDVVEESATSETTVDSPGRPLLALKLFVTNRVDGEPVTRAERLGKWSDWSVDYNIREVGNPEKAIALYRACRKRRYDGFAMFMKETEGDKVLTYYQRLLRKLSAQGRLWREERDQELERRGKVVYESHGGSTELRQLGELDTYLSWLYCRGGAKGRSD